MISHREIEEARREILSKSKTQIEEDTAVKWGARAIAAYSIFEESGSLEVFADATEYHHEAIEHASDTPILGGILVILNKAKSKAMRPA
jgi:hypothetical protein